MASKYLQKYQVPEGFYDILHEFTREVLRAQPEDILEYAANYFEHKSIGKEYYFESNHNVQRPAKPQASKQYQPTPHAVYSEQTKQIVSASNTHHANTNTNALPPKPVQRPPSSASATSEAQLRPATTHSINSNQSVNQNDTSKISHHSNKSDISHPDEKRITKEFVGDIYSSAIHKVINSSSQQEGEEVAEIENVPRQASPQANTEQGEKNEDVVLDGPVEEYENVAVKIQSIFRGSQVRKAQKNQ